MTGRRAARPVLAMAAVTAAGGTASWLLGRTAAQVAGNQAAPWIVGRASGVTAYLLLVAVVAAGLLLAHPWRTRISRPTQVTRIRLHVALTTFALAFTVLHVVVLACDRHAGVGWRGALLPMGAQYRPVAVTLGLVGLYAGLLSGVTATLAGRITARVWWPLHKGAVLALMLVWGHGVLAGSDSPTLLAGYLATGAGILILAVTRYVATAPADRLAAAHRSAGVFAGPSIEPSNLPRTSGLPHPSNLPHTSGVAAGSISDLLRRAS